MESIITGLSCINDITFELSSERRLKSQSPAFTTLEKPQTDAVEMFDLAPPQY